MPTTSYLTPAMAVGLIGARTDDTGAAVTDYTAEESRLILSILGQGFVRPANAFVVRAQSTPDMTVRVGSGTSKTDVYVIAGTVAGQGNYLARLDQVQQNVTIAAASASQARVDEIYLVMRDSAYDSSGRALPQIGYRQGDAGGGNPGPDAFWRASALLARVNVAANATSITTSAISDQRAPATLSPTPVPASLFTAKGDLVAATANATPVRVPVGADKRVLVADSSQAAGVAWSDIGMPMMKVLGDNLSLVGTGFVPIGSGGSEFVFNGVANGWYFVEAFLGYNVFSGTADIRLVWGSTGISSGRWSLDAVNASATDSIALSDFRETGLGNSISMGQNSADPSMRAIARARAQFGPSGGVLGLQAGLTVANGSGIITADSMFRVTRIA